MRHKLKDFGLNIDFSRVTVEDGILIIRDKENVIRVTLKDSLAAGKLVCNKSIEPDKY